MHTKTVFALGVLAALLVVAPAARAQMMDGYGPAATSSENEHDVTGATLWKELSSGATSCAALTESDFDALGDYFMGAMMGSGHDAMDRLMEQSLGTAGERQMHVAMGERLSGCNLSAAYPAGANGFFPSMMGMMMGMGGFGGPMMGYGYGFGYGGWGIVGAALLWILALAGAVALARLLWRKL